MWAAGRGKQHHRATARGANTSRRDLLEHKPGADGGIRCTADLPSQAASREFSQRQGLLKANDERDGNSPRRRRSHGHSDRLRAPSARRQEEHQGKGPRNGDAASHRTASFAEAERAGSLAWASVLVP